MHFGVPAHNYVPAIAFGLFPAPYDWNNKDAFIRLSEVILALPKKLQAERAGRQAAKLRWGGDWNMNGDIETAGTCRISRAAPWRDWAKKSKLYED